MEKPKIQPYTTTITDLLDNVFDTLRKPGEQLTLAQIKSRLEDNLDLPRRCIRMGNLKRMVYHLVDIGMYKSSFRMEDDEQIEVFSAGMPKAMDGMVNKAYEEE